MLLAVVGTMLAGLSDAWGQATILRVDADSQAGLCNDPLVCPEDVTTWDRAFRSLEDALAVGGNDKELWVAEGIYRPSAAYCMRSYGFSIEQNVSLYGGFVGQETTREDRKPDYFKTVLSGDTGANDLTPCTTDVDCGCSTLGTGFCVNGFCTGDNAYHVITIPAHFPVQSAPVIDGFTITAGRADGPPDDNVGNKTGGADMGGGIYMRHASPVVRNCIITGNYATRGGGVAVRAETSQPVFTDCTFSDNTAATSGGHVFGLDCITSGDCGDTGSVCSGRRCVGGACTTLPDNPFGDLDHSGFVTIFDLFCVLSGLENTFDVCAYYDVDIAGGNQSDCTPNGAINILDLNAVLDALGGIDSCCGAAPVAPAMSAGANTAAASLATVNLGVQCRSASVSPGGRLEVEVFADTITDLRVYEVRLGVTGGTKGSLDLVDIFIDKQHPDYVFKGLAPYAALDVAGRRVVNTILTGGVTSATPVYLGTFVFRASADVDGVFNLAIDKTQTKALNSSGIQMPITSSASENLPTTGSTAP